MEQKESKYLRAKERVSEIKKFYWSLLSSVFVIILVAGINYYLNQWRYPWFLWVVFGLCVSIIFNAFKTFGYTAFFGRDWEERKIREFMDRDDQNDQWK